MNYSRKWSITFRDRFNNVTHALGDLHLRDFRIRHHAFRQHSPKVKLGGVGFFVQPPLIAR
jgi:hypothetical protein